MGVYWRYRVFIRKHNIYFNTILKMKQTWWDRITYKLKHTIMQVIMYAEEL